MSPEADEDESAGGAGWPDGDVTLEGKVPPRKMPWWVPWGAVILVLASAAAVWLFVSQ